MKFQGSHMLSRHRMCRFTMVMLAVGWCCGLGHAQIVGTPETTPAPQTSQSLEQLAEPYFRRKFGLVDKESPKFTKAERALFAAAENGEIAAMSQLGKPPPAYCDPCALDADHVIRAACIEWLCKDQRALARVSRAGVHLCGMLIVDELDLRHAKVEFPLLFDSCAFDSRISANVAKLQALEFDRCQLRGSVQESPGSRVREALVADGAEVFGDLIFRNGCEVQGELRFPGAHIRKDFYCANSSFRHPDGRAINGDNASIGGLVRLDNMDIDGETNLAAMHLTGEFNCIKSRLRGASGCDLNFTSEPTGDEPPPPPAIFAKQAEIGGTLFFDRDSSLEGKMEIYRAMIGGDIDCSCTINARYHTALEASGVTVSGSIWLREGWLSRGQIALQNAVIQGDLHCSGTVMDNPTGAVIYASGARIEGSFVFESGASIIGEVVLLGAKTGRDIYCVDSSFTSPAKRPAFNAQGANVGGSVILERDRIDGQMQLESAHITDALVWKEIRDPALAEVNLRSASTHVLDDDESSRSSRFLLDGFTYQRLVYRPETRVGWIEDQLGRTGAGYHPTPYEQLGTVLRNMGYADAANDVAVRKADARRRNARPFTRDWIVYNALWPVAYGYKPENAFGISLIVIVVGWWFFRECRKHRLIDRRDSPGQNKEAVALRTAPVELPTTVLQPAVQPSEGHQGTPSKRALGPARGADENDGPDDFQPFMYSLELFVPFLKLGQADHWEPVLDKSVWLTIPLNYANDSARSDTIRCKLTGRHVRACYWVYKIIGAILSALWVTGLTGLAKG